MSFKQVLKGIIVDWAPSWWASYSHYRSAKEPEIQLLPSLCDPRIVAIDVGAHTGMYTRPLARLASHVHAFEPTETFTLLSRSVPGNVTVHRKAVSDYVGTATLSIPNVKDATTLATLESRDNFDGMQLTVPVTTLDEMFATETVGFVKIDVEGHEVSVVKGARALIARCRPVFLIECEERHHPGALDWLLSEFGDAKYSCCYLASHGHLEAVSTFDYSRDQVVGQKPYINNFIFLPPGHPLKPV